MKDGVVLSLFFWKRTTEMLSKNSLKEEKFSGVVKFIGNGDFKLAIRPLYLLNKILKH